MSVQPRAPLGGPPTGPPAYFAVSPSVVNFGNAPANTPTSITVTLTYIDPANTRPGSWFGVSLTNTQFTLTGVPTLPITFTSGQSQTFQITINQPIGTYSAACDISTNVGIYVVQVTAGSFTGGLSVVPPTLDFPNQIVGQTTAPLGLQIFNNSTSTVHLSAPTFSNADFAFAPTPPTFPVTLAPGANVSLFVTASPTSVGPDTGTLTLTSDLTGFNPISIPLTVVAVLFYESNALQGTSTNFIMGFGGQAFVPPPTQVVITPGSGSLSSGETIQFSANQPVTWSASAGSIDSTGLFTAPSVTTATAVTVTATSAPTSESATVSVAVHPVTSIAVAVSPSSATLQSNQTQQFSATVSNTANTAVTWTATIGTITTAGLYTAPDVSTTETATITATSVVDMDKSAQASVIVRPTSTAGPIDLLAWMGLTTRSTQHLVGDPKAPYAAFMMDIDSGYPAAYPAGVFFFLKNVLGNPWDICRYDANYSLMAWITEDGDAVDQPACQAANGTSCWLYAKAYKRYLNPVPLMPRTFTPGATITIDSPAPNDVARTTDCEATSTTVHIGDVRGVTTGPFKYTWGGSVDKGTGTSSSGPVLDSVNGVDTIKNEYFFSGTILNNDFLDREETYYVQGIGRVAWYYYHRASASSPWVWQNQTVNTTLVSGGSPTPNFPCGAGKPWW